MTETLLDELQPGPEWGDRPAGKLHWLSVFYQVKPDKIAARRLDGKPVVSRSALYAYMSGDREMSTAKKIALAEVIGFPVEAWDWPLADFDEWVRNEWPGFAGMITAA